MILPENWDFFRRKKAGEHVHSRQLTHAISFMLRSEVNDQKTVNINIEYPIFLVGKEKQAHNLDSLKKD